MCDDGDLKEKALSPEELAIKKKKEREENKAKDLVINVLYSQKQQRAV